VKPSPSTCQTTPAGTEEGLFAGVRAPLDELRDAGPHAVTEGADDHSESRTRLALAVTGEHQQQALVLIGARNRGVDHRLLALHAGAVALVDLALVAHAVSRSRECRPKRTGKQDECTLFPSPHTRASSRSMISRHIEQGMTEK
jgi:hypothetical protein